MNTLDTQSASCNRARVGKIARLPESIRVQLNERLRDGLPARLILPWLNALPEVQDVSQKLFSGHLINAQNLSAWRQGGYSDWLDHQNQLDRLKEMTAFASKLGNSLAHDAPQPVGRRCSDALTSHNPNPLAQGALLLATAKLFELLQSDTDFDQLSQIIKSLTAIQRTEISQQNTRLREKHLQLRDHSHHLARTDKQDFPAHEDWSGPKPYEADLAPVEPLAATA